MQTDALRKAGCERVFEDTGSGAQVDRPGLTAALAYLRDGDVLAVWRLDRLGRSLPHLIETLGALEARGVGFRSLSESIDTTTSGGPGQDTSILVYKLYFDGFKAMDLGGSATQSVVLMAILVALTVIQFRYVERKVHY